MKMCGHLWEEPILIIAEKLTVSVSFSAIFHNFFIATTGCRIDIGGVVEWLPQKK